jgi:TRAP-type mannitol/chloroaromatic compound transport system permease small subunit
MHLTSGHDTIDQRLLTIEKWIHRIGVACALVLLLGLMLVRNMEVFFRNVLDAPASVFNAMESELFLLFVFLIIGTATVSDSHVRVDILRERFSARTRAFIETVGVLVFVLPFAFIMLWFGSYLVESAWSHNERAAIGFGAPIRWIIVASLPLGIALFTLASMTCATRCIRFLRGRGPDPFNRG